MKKIYFTLVLSLLAMNVFGQSFNFQTDEENEPYVSGQIEYDCSAESAWKRMVSYVKSTYTSDHNEVTVDEDARTIVVTGCRENSKVAYNPFAGAFTENIMYTLNLKHNENGKVYYSFNSLSLNSQAAGFANYNKDMSVRTILKDYKRAQEAMTNTSLSKKEQKEAQKTVKDIETSLSKAYEVLINRVNSIKAEVE